MTVVPGVRCWIVVAAAVTGGLVGCASAATPAGSAATATAQTSGSGVVQPVGTVSAAPGTSASGGVPTTFRPGARPSTTAGSPLTEAANRDHLTVPLGTRLLVRLDPPNPAQAWDRLTVTAPALLHVQDERGGYPSSEALTATLLAAATGTVIVTTQSDQACLHSATPCLPPQLGWSVSVTIRA